jgi:hypothetical protein
MLIPAALIRALGSGVLNTAIEGCLQARPLLPPVKVRAREVIKSNYIRDRQGIHRK